MLKEKNIFARLLALLLVVGLVMMACDNGSGGKDGSLAVDTDTPNTGVFRSVDNQRNLIVLTLTHPGTSSVRAVYEIRVGDTFTLVVAGKLSSTGTVDAVSPTGYTFRNSSGSTFTARLSGDGGTLGGGLISFGTNSVPLDNGTISVSTGYPVFDADGGVKKYLIGGQKERGQVQNRNFSDIQERVLYPEVKIRQKPQL
jgi:hypothetical protein